MSNNLTAILGQVRNLIGDTSIVSPNFSDLMLTDFVNRAIEDLSQHFPRRLTYTVTTVATQHEYELETTHTQLLSVEYPTGETPPRYLERLPYTDPSFWLSEKHYDFILPGDGDSDNPPRLVISANPPDDETITLETAAEHSPLTTGSDETTIPDRYIHLIGLFVRWKCWQVLASQEAADPDPLHRLSATQEANATLAEATYRAALAAAQQTGITSEPAAWKMDKNDRIY